MKNYKDFTDDVSGEIIGGDYGTCWVTYEGRKQGATMYPTNETEAYAMCEDLKDEIKKDCGEVFDSIYPNKNGWMFHFDGI